MHALMADGAVYVGRAAPGLPASRFADAYRAHLQARPDVAAAARAELAGADLACWCETSDEGVCHAEVLLELLQRHSPDARDARDVPSGVQEVPDALERGPDVRDVPEGDVVVGS